MSLMIGDTHVELRGVDKRFGGVHALRQVSVEIRRGEVHALIGENGAGKSTLGKIVAGAIRHDSGELRVNDQPRSYRAPSDSHRDGIAIIDQELALLPMRSVIENVFLGAEFAARGVLRGRAAQARYDELIAETGFDLRANDRVGALRIGDQQKVEILRALARNAELIVMDEPSAALTPVEVNQLHAVIRSLTARGTTIVIVSHFLEEVLSIADRVSILRDGQFIRTAESTDETPATLVRSMLGRDNVDDLVGVTWSPPTVSSEVVLDVSGLGCAGFVHDVSLQIRGGEIVGLSGLVGSGRTEVCRAIFGADPITAGVLTLAGKRRRFRAPADAIAAGVALLPESRKEFGLVMGRSVRENISLAHLPMFARWGVLRTRSERRVTEKLSAQVGVKCASVDAGVSTLSGGNQQKVVLSRWLLQRPTVLIVDEPTRGVDVGAKAAIYELIRETAAAGAAVLVVSSEIEEILSLTHRVVVMARGRAVAEFDTATTTKDQLLQAAFDEKQPTAKEAIAP